MSPVKAASIILGLLIIILISASFYTVTEGSQAILLRLGKILESSPGQAIVEKPGLHFKIPLIDTIVKMDMRLQTDAAKTSRIYIAEERYLMVDYYIKWRIHNLSEFYTATRGDIRYAEGLMEQKVDNNLRFEFGKRYLKNIVAEDRANIMGELRQQAAKSVENLGLDVIDVRLQAIDLPDKVRKSVFNNMKADRKKVANSYRANGERQSREIRAKADADRITILAKANRQAQLVRAVGTSQSAKIYADAYSKNPGFYSFYRSLIAYKDVFQNRRDVLVLQPTGDFFKYFNNMGGNHKMVTAKQAD